MSRDIVYHLLQKGIQHRDVGAGRHAYSLMLCTGLDAVSVLADHLIRLFTVSGELQEAHCVFCRTPCRTVHTWNAIICAHGELGAVDKAIELFLQMHQDGMQPNKCIFLSVLKVCRLHQDLELGRLVHQETHKSGFFFDVAIMNTVIDMYVKCGSLEEARVVFDNMVDRDVVSWCIMIAGYVKCGHTRVIFELWKQMLNEGTTPNKSLYLSLLKVCISTGHVGMGRLVYYEVIMASLEADTVIVNILVDIFARFGALDDACDTFNKMMTRDIVSWGVMIAGYTQHDKCHQALELFDRLQLEGLSPSNMIVSCVLKACGNLGALNQGRAIHRQIISCNLKSDTVINNTLVYMYAKCRSIKEAEYVFNELHDRDVVSWGAMISAYADQDQGQASIELFGKMLDDGILPNKVLYLSVLKACGSLAAILDGRKVHNMVVDSEADFDNALGSTLVDMYAKCGSLDDARKVFDNLHDQDVVSWGVIIAGYVHHGQDLNAFQLCGEMLLEGVKPDVCVFLSLLKACDSIGSDNEVRLLHMQISCLGLERETAIENSLINLYLKDGSIDDAQQVFEEAFQRGNLSWNMVVPLFIQHGHVLSAVEGCLKMQQQGLKIDQTVFLQLLQTCVRTDNMTLGRWVHCLIIQDSLESNVVLGSSLIDIYAKCGSLGDSLEVFNSLCNRNMVSWGAMISGYAQDGQPYSALRLYEAMLLEGIEPTEATFVCGLKACANVGAITLGKVIHNQIVSNGLPFNIMLESVLVDMYAKSGALQDASKVFDEMPLQNAVSWSVIISGYALNECGDQTIELFETMLQDGFRPTIGTIIYVLKACGDTRALDQARKVHGRIIGCGVDVDVGIGNALINMYVKCGRMDEARAVFDRLPNHDVKSWSVLLVGYSENTDCTSFLRCLDNMQQEGTEPDDVIFTSILAACSHDGLLEAACFYLGFMRKYGIDPATEHYNCIVDLLSRAGYVHEAESVLKTMPVLPDVVGWRSILASCKIYGSIELGVQCFDEIKWLDPNDTSADVLMTNLCMNATRSEDLEVGLISSSASMHVNDGKSWIELGKTSHQFDQGSTQVVDVYYKLERLTKSMMKEGHLQGLDRVLEPSSFKINEETDNINHRVSCINSSFISGKGTQAFGKSMDPIVNSVLLSETLANDMPFGFNFYQFQVKNALSCGSHLTFK